MVEPLQTPAPVASEHAWPQATAPGGLSPTGAGPLAAPSPAGAGDIGWRAVVVLLGIVATVTGGIHWLRSQARLPTSPPSAQQQVAELSAATFRGTVKPGAELRLAAPASGVVREIHVRVGERVEAGAPLLTIDSREAEDAVARAEAEARAADDDLRALESRALAGDPRAASLRAALEAASAGVAVAQRRADEVPLRQRQDSPARAAAVRDQVAAKHRRVEELRAHGVVSEVELEESLAALRVADADLAAAQAAEARMRDLASAQAAEARVQAELGAAVEARELADLDGALRTARLRKEQAEREAAAARRRLGETTARADRQGVVVELPASVGDRVGAGTPLVRLAELDRLVVSVPVSARVVNAVRPGGRATILLPGRAEAMEAHVSTVNPLPDDRMLHVVEVEFANPSGALLVGQAVEVRFLPG